MYQKGEKYMKLTNKLLNSLQERSKEIQQTRQQIADLNSAIEDLETKIDEYENQINALENKSDHLLPWRFDVFSRNRFLCTTLRLSNISEDTLTFSNRYIKLTANRAEFIKQGYYKGQNGDSDFIIVSEINKANLKEIISFLIGDEIKTLNKKIEDHQNEIKKAESQISEFNNLTRSSADHIFDRYFLLNGVPKDKILKAIKKMRAEKGA